MNDYLVFSFKVKPLEPGRDILLAMLDLAGFDSYEEQSWGLKAYILSEDFSEEAMLGLPIFQNPEFEIEYSSEALKSINWNEEWERNYEPVELEDLLYIRAPFHPEKPHYRHQILIEPKMSFGTGHHQTTRLMSQMMFKMDFENKRVLDMGTGTGILAILAEQMGAASVLAIDNFDWAVENTAENAERNHCTTVEALLGDAASLKGRHFQSILANINRNVLLEDMDAYVESLESGGEIIFSGFFEHDFHLIDAEAQKNGLKLLERISEAAWQCCRYLKP